MEIRKLTAEEFSAVYAIYMQKDFPRDELKPLPMFSRLMADGECEALGYFDGGAIAAYAVLIWTEDGRTALLDHFAVAGERRGGGVGSGFIRAIAADRRFGAILLEVEDPLCADSATEREARQRRVDFYLKNGAAETGIRTKVMGVGYELLALGAP